MKMSLTINASTSGWKTTCIIFNKIHFILEIVLVFTGVLQTCPTEPLQQIDHRYYSTMFISELFNLWMWLRAELLCTHCIQAYGHNHNPNHNLNRADGQMVIFCCTSNTSHFTTCHTDCTMGTELLCTQPLPQVISTQWLWQLRADALNTGGNMF